VGGHESRRVEQKARREKGRWEEGEDRKQRAKKAEVGGQRRRLAVMGVGKRVDNEISRGGEKERREGPTHTHTRR